MRRALFLLLMILHYIIGVPYYLVLRIYKVLNHEKAVKLAYRHNQRTAKITLFSSGAKIKVLGLENLEAVDTALYVSNHRSMLDITMVLKYIQKPVIFLGKESVNKWPVISWWMRIQDTIFLDRTSPREGMKAIKKAIEFLKNGKSIILFPEGTRSKTGELLPFKKGTVRMAEKAGVHIVPIAIQGTDDVFEKNGFNLKPETIYMNVGKPIDITQVEFEEGQTKSEYLRGVIKELLDEIDTTMK